MHKKGFVYFEKLLDLKLKPKWEKIVKEVCGSCMHITINGKKVDRPAGCPLEALPLCYKCMMLWICTNNSAKCNKHYMSTTVKIPKPKVSIEQGIARLEELNNMSSYDPSLKSIK